MIPIPIPTDMLVSAASKLGIVLLEKALGDGVSGMIGGKLSKLFGFTPRVAIWDHERVPGLIWRLPDPDSPEKKERKMSDLDGLLIRNNEVVIYRAGPVEQPLIPGIWKLERKAKDARGAEIIYVQYSTFSFKWGIPRSSGPLTKDGVQVGISGEVRVRVSDAIKFVNEIVKSNKQVQPNTIREWIFSDIVAILRDQIQRMEASNLTSQELSMAVSAKGELELPKYGLTIEKLNVMYTALPEEFVAAKSRYGIARVEAESMKVMGKAKAEVDEVQLTTKAAYAERLMKTAHETGVAVKFGKEGDIEIGMGSAETGSGDSGTAFCPNCGSQIQIQGARFCPKCGKPLN
ncbi:MAG: SPFH domain-containing protein [Candidatus Ranarchaeia archaeon]